MNSLAGNKVEWEGDLHWVYERPVHTGDPSERVDFGCLWVLGLGILFVMDLTHITASLEKYFLKSA